MTHPKVTHRRGPKPFTKSDPSRMGHFYDVFIWLAALPFSFLSLPFSFSFSSFFLSFFSSFPSLLFSFFFFSYSSFLGTPSISGVEKEDAEHYTVVLSRLHNCSKSLLQVSPKMIIQKCLPRILFHRKNVFSIRSILGSWAGRFSLCGAKTLGHF